MAGRWGRGRTQTGRHGVDRDRLPGSRDVARFRVDHGPRDSLRHARASGQSWRQEAAGSPMTACYAPRPTAPAGIGAGHQGPFRP
jgi:hypothetical protein